MNFYRRSLNGQLYEIAAFLSPPSLPIALMTGDRNEKTPEGRTAKVKFAAFGLMVRRFKSTTGHGVYL